MLVAHDDRMEGRHFLVPVDDRVPAEVRAGVQGQIQVAEDRREIVVVIPSDQDRGHAILQEPEHLLHLDPFVDEVLRKLVLEVPGDDDFLRLPAVEHLAEPLEDHAPLEPGDRDALLGEGSLEAKMEIRYYQGPLVAEEQREVSGRLDAPRDLEAVHGPPLDGQ